MLLIAADGTPRLTPIKRNRAIIIFNQIALAPSGCKEFSTSFASAVPVSPDAGITSALVVLTAPHPQHHYQSILVKCRQDGEPLNTSLGPIKI